MVVIVLLASCTKFIFYPQHDWQLAKEVRPYSHKQFFISADDGVALSAMRIVHQGNEMLGAVLFFHGNSGNIGSESRYVYWLSDAGYDVVLVDYRGYGLSQGEPNLKLNMGDIVTVSQWFSTNFSDEPRYMLAHSLGASMVGYVMAIHPELHEKFNAIILDAGFAGYRRIMRDAMSHDWVLWFLRYPASLGMPDDYDLLDVVQDISPTPLMIVHGTNDPVVPYCHGLDLYNKAKAPKAFLGYEGVHTDAFEDAGRRQQVLDFMAQYR